MSVRSKVRRVRRMADIAEADGGERSLLARSAAQIYLQRLNLSVPSRTYLAEVHPTTHLAMWQFVLLRVSQPCPTACPLPLERVAEHWSDFLRGLSWWEFQRHFKVVQCAKSSETLRLRPAPDILVVTPYPRLAKARQDSEWAQSCRTALLAYCNHGPCEPSSEMMHKCAFAFGFVMHNALDA